jgi:hypothetical protein
VAVILKAQRRAGPNRGGWRYRVEGDDADLSVTGWQVLALRSARNAGCDVPAERIDAAAEFVRRCHDPVSGGYRYQPGTFVTPACTGTAVSALELCGKEHHRAPASLRAAVYLIKNPPNPDQPHFFYGAYYGALATFQLGGNEWQSYRPRLYEALLRTRRTDGSWHGKLSDDLYYGPNYCTAMAVLALTADYHLLPVHQRGADDPPVGK